MNLYETTFSADTGLAPVRVKGRVYDINTADLISTYPYQIREIYRKRSGEYFLYLLVVGVGKYIAPLTDLEAEALIELNRVGQEQKAEEARAPHMTDAQLTHAFAEALNYTDPDAFVSDLLLSAAFLSPDDPEAEPDLALAEPLRRVWHAAALPFADLLREMGLTQAGLSRRYGIPIRTVQDWAGGRRTPPSWVRLMLAELANYWPR